MDVELAMQLLGLCFIVAYIGTIFNFNRNAQYAAMQFAILLLASMVFVIYSQPPTMSECVELELEYR